MILDNSYANRIEGLFYSKSDEKFTLRSLLDEILGERRFDSTLDVGPGAGHISEPLARRSKRITMVEKDPRYEEALKNQFENARVLVSPVAETGFTEKFDVILFSHVLYYHPENDWMALTERLYKQLTRDGEIILILNADYGDWWKIIGQFWSELRPHIAFHYILLSQFKKELSRLGKVQVHPYRYQMWVEPGAAWLDFVGRQLLELTSDDVLLQNEQRFNELAKGFKQIDGSYVLDFRGEVLRVKAGR